MNLAHVPTQACNAKATLPHIPHGSSSRAPQTNEAKAGAPQTDDAKPGAPQTNDAKPGAAQTDDAKPGAPQTDDAKPGAPQTDDAKPGAPQTKQAKAIAPPPSSAEVSSDDDEDEETRKRHKRMWAKCHRLCNYTSTGKLNVPEDVHKMWVEGGNAVQKDLITVMEECDGKRAASLNSCCYSGVHVYARICL